MGLTLFNDMLLNIKDMLLQLLIVLFPFFLLQVHWLKESTLQLHKWGQQRVVSVACTLGIVLSLFFSVNIHEQIRFDLSHILLITSVLYGGYVSGSIALLALILFKIIFAHHDLLITGFMNGGIFLLSIIFIRRYVDANRLIKVSFFTTMVCLASIVQSLFNLYLMSTKQSGSINTEIAVLLMIYPLVGMMAIWIIIHLVENVREKQLMEMEIQKAERLNIIGHLAASVAHEIRNPMTVVRGFMQIFDKETFIPDNKKVYIKLMIQELDRAEGIINDYLTLARPRLEKMERIAIKEQMDSVMEIISSFAMLHNIRIQHQMGQEDLHVKGIPEKLSQVLINLIKNAIEASPEGQIVHISAYRTEEKAVIEIKDQGIGLSQEEIKRIGTPFYTTKENGTGLGLMVCYQIIKSMNGKIEVFSEKNKGTQFIIKLPAVD
ncbi:ATP-binding protein [Marinicrinis lubricantis]|uniref:histidine kinase n=1 Tax=Marinicrinis lubricantis TaxID=2086470 RepID=A0ABW1IT94_9BACL